MSERARWQDTVRATLRALAAYEVPQHRVAVKLDANESPFPPPAELLAAIAAALPTLSLNRYPDPNAAELRGLVAADLDVAPERLLFGNGSDELIGLLAATFAEPPPGEPRARMAWPGPSFVVYRTAAAAAGMLVVEAPLGPRFEPDYDALDRHLRAAPVNLVFVATPNNPTGTSWPRPLLERLLEEHPGCVVVLDEAYCAYGGASLLDLVDRFPHCAVLRTYSKIGLAALRVGVLVGQPALVREVEKVRGPYNLGALPQLAATIALSRFGGELAAHVAEIVSERERLLLEVGRLPGVEVFPSSANLFVLRLADASAVWQALLARGVLVRNLDRPGALAGCLRVTVGTPDENQRFLVALAAALGV